MSKLKESGFDHTLTMLKEGYTYIPNRTEKYQSPIFFNRVLGGKPCAIISGKEAAELFYNNDLIERKGTMPKRIVKTLFGKGAIHTTTGKVHIDRKALFMSLMTDENLSLLRQITKDAWENEVDSLIKVNEVNVYKKSSEVLTKVGLKWAGIEDTPKNIDKIAKEMDLMIDSFGQLGGAYKGYRAAQKARANVEAYLQNQIKKVRKGKLKPRENSALYAFSHWKDMNNKPMDLALCAVDLMNVIRPLVAINRFVTYGVLAIHEFNGEKDKLKFGTDDYVYQFVQEVRRFYPFVPYLPGKAKKKLTFDNQKIKKDQMILLDVYGTLHNEKLWEYPNRFDPTRFENWDGSPFDLIPQGGGDYHTNHRCAGEWMTIIIMEETMKFFTRTISFEVPPQDFTVDLTKLPGKVASGMNIRQVQALNN
ncbi:cytochrome P450 [Macrococcus sp. DPC7161]|uniref:cytochrome P450 n=1 Tax=Macrococcus sp. DPC7161 TaxID=2507060 RepID=UPI00100B2614|nr:cytochrome P450 [Macrococcus sp. DPC7161]RXK18941.1 cytochrome P450 [Macrococcus sp. DPC7161]